MQMFHGGGEWLPDLSKWAGVEDLLRVVFLFLASGLSQLFYCVGNLLYWDYLYFLELFYVLLISVCLFVLGDHKGRFWPRVKYKVWVPVLIPKFLEIWLQRPWGWRYRFWTPVVIRTDSRTAIWVRRRVGVCV